MRGKRGISPLIATVLLIGFSVALGVMIMSITQPLITSNCDDVTIKNANFCKSGNALYPFIEGKEGKEVCLNYKVEFD
ncbi:MAG: hypothetical protein V1743_06810, partial [Nanoarchaeota archaeon]